MKFISIKNCPKNLIDSFSCGNEKLDEFFKNYALQNDKKNLGKTFILMSESILGFFTLANASIQFEELNDDIKRKLPKYPIPCIRIARLAVSKDYQGNGYGKQLLKEAFERIIKISKITGIYFIIVDAKVTSKQFYEKYGFIHIGDGLKYILPIKTLLKAFENGTTE